MQKIRPNRWRRTVRALVGVLAVGLVATLAPQAATAAPVTPNFPSSIDAYAPYDGQTRCGLPAQPGAVGLRDLLNRTYGKHNGGIVRECSSGGQSEHKEGRALDYMLDINKPADKAAAEDVLQWLLATDKYGNEDAMARRLGIMYMIWNHRIWSAHKASQGWQPYDGPNPHTDHIHFSLSWAGAKKQTTWWTSPEVSQEPRGPLYNRSRWLSSGWDDAATLVDSNTKLVDTAIASVPSSNAYAFTLVKGGGVYYRLRDPKTSKWVDAASPVDTNGAITKIAATATPDGTLHLLTLVPGNGVYYRFRNPSTGVWTSRQIENNPYSTDIAIAAIGNNVQAFNVVPGSGVWSRQRINGVWDAEASIRDTNPYITDIAATGSADGAVHLFTLVPGSGVWHRLRDKTTGNWTSSAVLMDENDAITAISATTLPKDGNKLVVSTIVPGSGLWIRTNNGSQTWTADAQLIDGNHKIFDGYVAGLNDGTLQAGALVNAT
jgi:hypothetical protein